MTRSATQASEKIEPENGNPPATPAVIPSSNMIILRESELDCDLTTAIQRIRADRATGSARILVVGPEGQDEERMAPSMGVLPPVAPMTLAQFSRNRESAILEEAGSRLLPLLGCLDRFAEESKSVIDALDEEVTDQTRARLRNRIATLSEIQEWTKAVMADMSVQANTLAEGRCLVDTVEICEDMARQIEARFPSVRVLPFRGDLRPRCIGRAADLAEAFYLAMGLVAQRIGGCGRIHLEIHQADGFIVHRIAGDGEPRQIQAAAWVERFRELVVGIHGGKIQPDLTGVGGTGISLELPALA